MGKTIAEKIFSTHLKDQPTPDSMVLKLDVVLCHEITTPIAIMDLIEKGKDKVFDPAKIKAVIDHVTPAKDSKTAKQGKITVLQIGQILGTAIAIAFILQQ